MDSTPISQPSDPRSRTKSASRLSKLRHYSGGAGSPIKQLSLEIVPSSPKISTPSPASTISPRPPYTLPLQELLLLSPSPCKRSKILADVAEDAAIESCGVRKRCKSRNSASGCGVSPRSSRRPRRRLDQDVREERERENVVAVEEMLAKPRKKRQSRKEKTISSQLIPSNRSTEGESYNLDGIGEIINDLVMWKDVSKSSFWFGFGSLCFLSSCFAKGVTFSIFSFLSQIGLLFLGVSFLSNSLRQRDSGEIKREFKLKEEDILRFGRFILPAANLAISKTREIFSGEPAMTLKVVPFLLVGAEYGHIITLWRLCAFGFFVSFTCPKLYSAYSSQLSKRGEYVKCWALDAWRRCTRKKIVAASAVTAVWNLTSIRTRIFAAFLCLVILRYRRQRAAEGVADDGAAAAEEEEEKQEEQKEEKALVTVEIESKK